MIKAGVFLWLATYDAKAGPVTASVVDEMFTGFKRSMACRSGFVPVALAVNQAAPEPRIDGAVRVLPVVRTVMPPGHVAFLLDHELETD